MLTTTMKSPEELLRQKNASKKHRMKKKKLMKKKKQLVICKKRSDRISEYASKETYIYDSNLWNRNIRIWQGTWRPILVV